MPAVTATTKQVFDHHLQALLQRDLPGTVADYHDDAVLITANDVFRGKEAISGFFKYVFEVLLTEGYQAEVLKQVVEEDFIFIVWQARSAAFDLPHASDTFLIQNGLIVRQTAYAVINSIA